MEWIDPRYARVIDAMRKAQAEADANQHKPGSDPQGKVTVRGFIIPGPPAKD